MSQKDNQNHAIKKHRRKFLKQLSGAVALTSSIPSVAFSSSNQRRASSSVASSSTANSQIQFASIGMGIMGFNNTKTAVKVPGAKLIAACDLYDGRLNHAKEVYGNDLLVTKRYQEILNDPAIDAVIISTTDHWHDKIAMDAMKKGKAVYCEKPMVHHINEGLPMIETQNQTGQVCQVGSQRVSSVTYLKAKELYEAGEIGQLVVAEGFWDRQSANGAWQYSIPRDASTKTIDWETYLGDAPKKKFDPVRFFRWRNYQDYGTGIAGDIFVHLFSGLHLITGSLGPNRIYASGGLRYWHDGRDVPDMMVGIFDYPSTKQHSAFNLQVRVNFIDGGGGGQQLTLIGTEGKMIISGNSVKVTRNTMADAPGYGGWDTYETFDEQNKKDYADWYEKYYAGKNKKRETTNMEWHAPKGYSDHYDHHANFIQAVRTKGKVVENAEFGFRAAAVALASNKSLFDDKAIHWDPEAMKLK